jgi:hypothetical protein
MTKKAIPFLVAAALLAGGAVPVLAQGYDYGYGTSAPASVAATTSNAGATTASASRAVSAYKQTNLVSDQADAPTNDSHLVNPWGIVSGPNTPFWIADNATGLSTLYDGAGKPFPVGGTAAFTVPTPADTAAGTMAAPTGVVYNGTPDFVVGQGQRPAQRDFCSRPRTARYRAGAPLWGLQAPL